MVVSGALVPPLLLLLLLLLLLDGNTVGAANSATQFQTLNVRAILAESTQAHPAETLSTKTESKPPLKTLAIQAESKTQPKGLSQHAESKTHLSQPSKHTETKTPHSQLSASKPGNLLRLKLLHRDSFKPTNSSSHKHRFESRMRRDLLRVAALAKKLGLESAYKLTDFGAEVVSGMEQGSGEYFVRIGVGSPARDQFMVIDTGSDIVWVQCRPCLQCYQQADPVFDPAASETFAGVSCTSSVCSRLENSGCGAGRCRYEVSYGDGSYTKGTLALETLTFQATTVRNVAMGCGHKNHGLFIGAAGLLGLGGGSMSFNGQLGGQMGGAFGYCLVSRGATSGSTGELVFGKGAMPLGAVQAPMLRDLRAPTFYFVGLAGLAVGSWQLPLSKNIFGQSDSVKGMILDSGTAVTRLPTVAYEALRDAFVSATQALPRAPAQSIFDTCYDLRGLEMVTVPTVSFYFAGGPILTLPAGNYMIPVDDGGTFCLALAPSVSGISIFGNIQQEGIQISFDSENGLIGFGPNTC
ncbi:hypothetical protein AMTRI_Chr09g12430 [Amborella trichopoda]